MDKKMWIAAAVSSWLAACSQQPGPGALDSTASDSTSPPAVGDEAAQAPATPTAASPSPASKALPAQIVADRAGFVPQSAVYDKTNRRFLAASLTEGTIFSISPDGAATPFIEDTDLVSSVGIAIDEARGRLLVADAGRRGLEGQSKGEAKLGVYDMKTGKRLAMVDLTAAIRRPPPGARFFADAVAVGSDGTVYVTDMRQNAVYAVGGDYKARLLYQFEPRKGLALRGIVYAPEGYLIVAGGSGLFRLTTGDPATMNEISLPEPIKGAGGLTFLPDGHLAVVSNSNNRVVELKGGEHWYRAEAVGSAGFKGRATSGVVAEGRLYVVHPHADDKNGPVLEGVALR
ncbi:MAG TPA: hypothetical protein VFY39_13620 [Gammaproteobacteria bacterium]|nr:hypothetical protein [Gammaproteobacteria bacterium]